MAERRYRVRASFRSARCLPAVGGRPRVSLRPLRCEKAMRGRIALQKDFHPKMSNVPFSAARLPRPSI